MCGIAGIIGQPATDATVEAMLHALRHRGPDASGSYTSPTGLCRLGHRRLSIIDLSDAGRQPMADPSGRYWLVLNGEIYNYLELKRDLADYPFRSKTDTEVLLAAYLRYGEACLDKCIGMFAFAVWDEREQRLFCARDRFGVKPFYYHLAPDTRGLCFASEIKALHAAGVPRSPDAATWATYLASGLYDHSERTFWEGVRALPGGHCLTWQNGETRVRRWYDLAVASQPEFDARPEDVVLAEYAALMQDSVRLRFRADVPVGINLSGGVDSSALLAIVERTQLPQDQVRAFTFVTGAPEYDELPWVEAMLARTRHPLAPCRLSPGDVPAEFEAVARVQDEPFGGLPTLAYAWLFAEARRQGTIVLLDGQGMDEQWCGYDYYRDAMKPAAGTADAAPRLVQGTRESPVRPGCLLPEFRATSIPAVFPKPFPDALRNLQYRDVVCTKIPRALRFNDRVSMRASTELREPFLDHRLLELAFRQPPERKIRGEQGKYALRCLLRSLLPASVVEAPKRALQTTQREWLRGPLHEFADALIARAIARHAGTWLDADAVRRDWATFSAGQGDNSFFVWQWMCLGAMA